VKSASFMVRVAGALKTTMEQHAKREGTTLASYVERVLELHHAFPVWLLRDVQPHNRGRHGPCVAFSIADGWPAAEIGADHAQRLGEQLIAAAISAKGAPPS
jgi:hypothetical protein